MIHAYLYLILLLTCQPPWGFFGHRLINRVAVYTVPTEMIGWYKPYIDYISEHAVDPDKRRYATKHEAVRHFIDLDHWGALPFDHMPRYFDQVLALNLELFQVKSKDTTLLLEAIPYTRWLDSIADYKIRIQLVREHYQPQYYEDVATVSCSRLKQLYPGIRCDEKADVYMRDVFSEHGIVPYHLQVMQRRLTEAFKNNDLDKVMRISSELGHYIGDACVPLHTTSNYNGQLSGQEGIHAFWESRIPELFALDEFDMVVGRASYIDDPVTYFWDLVISSHAEVDRVLGLEKELRETFPSDRQFCFEDRLNSNIKTQCPEFAKAYNLAMDNMVEDRFRIAVRALGDAWYTAWIDAGQPTPPMRKQLAKQAEDEELNKAVQSGKALGREHDN